MAQVYRVSGFHQGRIDANIAKVWALITDWGTLAWFDDGSNSEGMKLMDCWLEGEPGAVPRTRVMSRGEAAVENGAPMENREVLLLEDPVAHRLFYDAEDGFVPGIRNYIASWALDEIDDGACQITITSTFDVVPPDMGETYRDMLQGIYVAIAFSLQKHFSKQKSLKAPA